jgi:hypothetical protein
VRIPLDYYRILGVLTDAELGSIEAAYQDRREQQPRREYSDLTLRSRQNLIDEAYAVLSSASQRREYDKQLQQEPLVAPKAEIALPKIEGEALNTADFAPNTPCLNIKIQDLGGALSILQELGEYELVSKIGRRELKNRLDFAPEELGLWQLYRQDIILSVALACLHRGREEYEMRDYEASAACQQEGLDLLAKEGILPSLQEEIQIELNNLRPYRILGLLSLELDRVEERLSGLHLLREMLQERRGIEGKGNDRSGLSNEEFVRFIEQLRGYLTVDEQLELFESEANRPSATATYLLAYALLAKGFAHKQPEALVRAQTLLKRFDPRQDLYLERSICALLLGRTEAASNLLVKSQESESIEFIREHSQGAPDLLPGLCLYGERWLEGEVLSEFRDLHQQKLCLKDYFADRSVQAYLEELASNEEMGLEEEFLASPSLQKSSIVEIEENTVDRPQNKTKTEKTRLSWGQNRSKQANRTASTVDRGRSATAEKVGYGRGGSATIERELHSRDFGSAADDSYSYGSDYLSQPDWRVMEEGDDDRRRPHRKSVFALIPAFFGKKTNRSRNSRKNNRSNPRLFLGLLGLMAIALLTWLALKPKQQATEIASTDRPLITLQEPAIDLPSEKPDSNPPSNDTQKVTSELDENKAKEVVERWLEAKRSAMGSQHDGSKLTEILDGASLKLWQGRSQNIKGSSDYLQYEHAVTGATVLSPSNGKTASIQAKVREKATYYRGQKIDRAKSYDQNLTVNYDLVWKNNRWAIANIRVK